MKGQVQIYWLGNSHSSMGSPQRFSVTEEPILGWRGETQGTPNVSFTGSRGGRKAAKIGQWPPGEQLKHETRRAVFKSFTYFISKRLILNF